MALAQAPTIGIGDDLVTYIEAQKLLGVGPQALKNAIARGRMHPVKFPGVKEKYLYRGEVEAYRDRRPWFPPPGVTIAQGWGIPGVVPGAQIGAGMAPLVTMPDLVTYAQTILREGQQAASAVAESAMRPIGDALKPISEAIADSQRPAPAPADITKVDEMLASVKAQMGMMLLQFIEALRPMVEAINAGRQVTREDTAPIMAIMERLTREMQDTPVGPGLTDALAHVPDLLSTQPDTPASGARHSKE